MPALYHHARVSPRNDENTTRGTALASILGISLSVVVVLGLLAVVYMAVTRFYRHKTQATRRAQEEGSLRSFVRVFDRSPSAQDRSTYPYHHIERDKHKTQQSGTAPLLGEDILGLSSHESQDAARSSVVSTQEFNREESLPLSFSNEMQASTGPDHVFSSLPMPLSAGGSIFTLAGTREAMSALPPIDTTSPLTTAPLSAATASTAGPFSAFLGHAPLSATTTCSDSTFSALDHFPPPPVPALPAWCAGGDELKKRKQEEAEEDQLGRTDTMVVGQMLKMRARRAEAGLSRGFTNISAIERSDSIKSLQSPLHSTSTKRARSKRRLTSLKIPLFFAPSTISPTSLNYVTPLAVNPPSRTSVPTIGGPRPLRKGSKMPTLPMETLTEDPSPSSTLTDPSESDSVPLPFSSTTVPGFTALMARPESKWPVTPATSLSQESSEDNGPFNPPEASLTTAFRESIPLSAATLDTFVPTSEWRDLRGSHPPPSFRLPAAAFAAAPVSGDSTKSTAPLRINPTKFGRSNNRSSSDNGHATDAEPAQSDEETRARSRDSATSDSIRCPKPHTHTEVDLIAVTRSQSKPRRRPPSLERPAARVVGARMRGASTSSVSSDCSGAGHPVLGPKTRVHDIGHARQVPEMDAMLGRYHRVASMQGVVELGQ
ncbi:hypothetical protein BDN71DRAFT_1446335 [Pleurotus eryngii]|uniref:Uncharacterized protein n=1 Tax=Pleurotus eryngii TaxID=5323 RepID=A0A9P6DG82_PLEER|nr:hypothetical protein BDN71DRAFT_1446335 [Pleurotus eryngii]